MEREGPHTENGSTEADRAGNVVRFPRTWFGPPDELVPIGRSVRPPEPSSPPPPERDLTDANARTGWASDGVLVPLTPSSRDPEPPPARARTAADFWGEESATVHDALQAPPPTRIGAIAARTRGGIVELGRSARRVRGTPAPLMVALALAVAAVFLATRQDDPGGSRSPQGRSHTHGAAATAARREGTILAASVLEAARHASRRAAPRVSARRVHPTLTRSHHTIPAATAAGPAAAQPPPVSTPVTSASTQSISVSSGSAAPSSSSATVAGARQAGPSQAGPTGPAAAFGPGY